MTITLSDGRTVTLSTEDIRLARSFGNMVDAVAEQRQREIDGGRNGFGTARTR